MSKNLLKKIGVKVAYDSIGPLCFPYKVHQPIPPARLLQLKDKKK